MTIDGRQQLIQILWQFPILFLLMSSVLIPPRTASAQTQQRPAGEKEIRGPDQVYSVSGTILIRNESGNQIYYLDTDGDGTEDYRLEFTSPAQHSNLPAEGDRVKITGRVHGQTLGVLRIREQ